VARRFGAKNWRAISTNVMTHTVREALPNIGWTYVPGRGPGGGSRFTRNAVASLTPRPWSGADTGKAVRRACHACQMEATMSGMWALRPNARPGTTNVGLRRGQESPSRARTPTCRCRAPTK
jgi:hypothetical protein